MKTALKIDPGPRTWAEVDARLKELGYLQGQVDKCRARYEAKIETLKAELAEHLARLRAEQEALAREVYLYALQHQDELEGRSKRLTHGAVAFHRSVALKLPRDQARVVAALEALGKTECLEIVKKIKKVELRRQDPAVLQAVGARLVKKDNFRIELPEHALEIDKKIKVVKK